ncbi:sll0787 family AIR synthase-like protein [Nitratireductor sp. ZSWI3]|uniref:sll0787 family AIR synthase-like protein n=1 Tax=Nitratireductor sp. ZSWI3 TaxID=2966359 RepID=UPI00215034EC|nr:sll0787 family AIR synthase-like protein [Nitratireductor sp. ZSWI3]MCR4265179.1 sll0787 family AIR synthase-like protein [Nitratireductor sp. ZSWI3]
MSPATLDQLVRNLREHPSIRSKLAIGAATNLLGIGANSAGQPGDDAAVLPRDDGTFDLFAGEGFIPAFVNDDPWFAGWCGVMVNLSDIAAMGGRAIGVLDQVWAPNAVSAQPLLEGLRDAAAAYDVPILGGHTNFAAAERNLAVSILGRARALISSFAARPGDILVMAADMQGDYRNYDNFFAAGSRSPTQLKANLEILPTLSELQLVCAGKDISQGGIVGTALMLAECSGVGIDIAIDRLAPPSGVGVERWLRTFPSFGYLLAVPPHRVEAVSTRFQAHDIWAGPIGEIVAGSSVRLRAGEAASLFWDHARAPYLNLPLKSVQHA